MSSTTLRSLVEKLNKPSRQSLESATALCQSRTHFTVEIEHWLCSMLTKEQGDISLICSYFSVDSQALIANLQSTMEKHKSGNGTLPGISPHVVELLRQCWLNTTIEFQDNQIRSAYLLYTLLKDDTLSALLVRRCHQLDMISPEKLLLVWPELRKDSAESNDHESGPAPQQARRAGETPALAQYSVDLTAQARSGLLDPILGRDHEIRQIIDILSRRRQNNPILTGEAGVGKTAVVEGLALRIAAGDVPDKLKSIAVRMLDLALLQAGAGMKGEFENRLNAVIEEVKSSPTPIIMFIDEAHSLIGSGGQAGQNDAANLLKPALARGELRTIAATTWAEYKKYFEKDAALTRRFQVVKIEEPDVTTAVTMMRGLLPVLAAHHNVRISDQALRASVVLSERYINGRKLPDKAVGLLDTACARVAMSQEATPGSIEDQQRSITLLDNEIDVLTQEQLLGVDHANALDELTGRRIEHNEKLLKLTERWAHEKALVGQIKQITDLLLDSDSGSQRALQVQLREIEAELMQQNDPMVHWQVNEFVVAEVVSDWTGIPLGRMQAGEVQSLLDLQEQLQQRVIGQSHALTTIAHRVHVARAHLGEENRPNAVLMLSGPSGVGKTETALALAEYVYGSEDNVICINMSEYKEEHKVSLLLGSPPGYVGYGEGGVLTEAVRRKPYSVVLLDEMEKAHPGVQDIFYQVFDKGTIKDGEGRDIDFKNTIIIMTSNIGTETTLRLFEDQDMLPSADGLAKAIKTDLLVSFKPAFLGRINVIPYFPLNADCLAGIVEIQLQRISARMYQQYQFSLHYGDDVVEAIVANCEDGDVGARTIYNIIQNQILPELSMQILQRFGEKKMIAQAEILMVNDGFRCKLS